MRLVHDRVMRILAGLSVAAACLLALAVGSALAKQAVVTMKDGRTLEGRLVDQDQSKVVLEIAGIRTPVNRDQIKGVKIKPSIEEQYHDRRAKLKDSDLDGRYELSLWLFHEGAYKLAGRELADLQQRFPESDKVHTLAAAVQGKEKLQRESAANPAPANPTPQPRRSPSQSSQSGQSGQPVQPGQAAQQAQHPELLTPKQIAAIKVWELPEDVTQARVRIQVPRKVILEVFDKYRQDPLVPKGQIDQRDFFRRSDASQLEFLFSLAARHPDVRNYYQDVRISGDPQPIIEFRRRIYPVYVLQYFRGHFGQGQVKGLHLLANEPNELAEIYTNFYILSQFTYHGRKMLDRTTPADSLFVQWGLPRTAAKYPAPDIKGWQPFYTGVNDPKYTRAVDWIDSLYKGAGDYGIQYNPSGAKANASDQTNAGTSGNGQGTAGGQ